MAEEKLVCSKCSNAEERVYLNESMGAERVRCPKCEDSWPNFLQYPVQPVMNIKTGQAGLSERAHRRRAGFQ